MVPVSDNDEWIDSGDQMQTLALEYAEATRRSEAEWIYVQQPRDGELQYATFSYLPEHHFRRAYDRLTKHSEIEPDGGITSLHKGKRGAQVYYWLNPDTGAALYHTAVNEEAANIFFETVEDAETFLEQQVAANGAEQYEGLSLYQSRTRKIRDAKDVLTDQAGIDEFLPDGGLQITNPQPDDPPEQVDFDAFRQKHANTGGEGDA